MDEIKSCIIHWHNNRSDIMELGNGETLVYVLTLHNNFQKIEFDFAGKGWLALGNPKGQKGVMLASSDMRKQVFVEAGNDMNEFIQKSRVTLRGILELD